MGDTDRGFTLVLCNAQACAAIGPGLHALRACVRESRLGILVCASGTEGMPTPAALGAAMAVLQPCDADRRPTAEAVPVGPLCTPADVADLVTWIRRGTLDRDDLPHRLRALDRARKAGLN